MPGTDKGCSIAVTSGSRPGPKYRHRTGIILSPHIQLLPPEPSFCASQDRSSGARCQLLFRFFASWTSRKRRGPGSGVDWAVSGISTASTSSELLPSRRSRLWNSGSLNPKWRMGVPAHSMSARASRPRPLRTCLTGQSSSPLAAVPFRSRRSACPTCHWLQNQSASGRGRLRTRPATGGCPERSGS